MESPAFFAIQPDEFVQRLLNALLPALDAKFREHEPEKLLTQQEAAIELGACVATLINWGHKGILKPIKRGNRVYYKWSEIMAVKSAAA